jgi:hypothetical protein
LCDVPPVVDPPSDGVGVVDLILLLPVIGIVSFLTIMFYYMTRMVEPPDDDIRDPNEVPLWIKLAIGVLIILSILTVTISLVLAS